MSNITKKQATYALIAVVFATAMIVSTIALAGDQAFAKKSNKKSISFKQSSKSHNSCKTAGGTSPIDGFSCNSFSSQFVENSGGNA